MIRSKFGLAVSARPRADRSPRCSTDRIAAQDQRHRPGDRPRRAQQRLHVDQRVAGRSDDARRGPRRLRRLEHRAADAVAGAVGRRDAAVRPAGGRRRGADRRRQQRAHLGQPADLRHPPSDLGQRLQVVPPRRGHRSATRQGLRDPLRHQLDPHRRSDVARRGSGDPEPDVEARSDRRRADRPGAVRRDGRRRRDPGPPRQGAARRRQALRHARQPERRLRGDRRRAHRRRRHRDRHGERHDRSAGAGRLLAPAVPVEQQDPARRLRRRLVRPRSVGHLGRGADRSRRRDADREEGRAGQLARHAAAQLLVGRRRRRRPGLGGDVRRDRFHHRRADGA